MPYVEMVCGSCGARQERHHNARNCLKCHGLLMAAPSPTPSPCTVERSPRQVIEGKLLAALEEPGQVAILVDRRTLDFLIHAVETFRPVEFGSKFQCQLLADLRQLSREAYGRG